MDELDLYNCVWGAEESCLIRTYRSDSVQYESMCLKCDTLKFFLKKLVELEIFCNSERVTNNIKYSISFVECMFILGKYLNQFFDFSLIANTKKDALSVQRATRVRPYSRVTSFGLLGLFAAHFSEISCAKSVEPQGAMLTQFRTVQKLQLKIRKEFVKTTAKLTLLFIHILDLSILETQHQKTTHERHFDSEHGRVPAFFHYIWI